MVRSSFRFAVLCLLGLLVSPSWAEDPTQITPGSSGLLKGNPIRNDSSDSALNAETMKAALHTATVEEEGFIERALKKSQSGELPAGMLESTFLWARRKPAHQFQYFKHALTLRAKEAGVDLEQPDAPATTTTPAKRPFWDVLYWWRTWSKV